MIIIHMTPADVCASAEYIGWCAGLRAETQQLFLNFTPQPQRFAFLTSVRPPLTAAYHLPYVSFLSLWCEPFVITLVHRSGCLCCASLKLS